ncbi:MAG: DUF1127 domain-containing protein [Pseudomonadota bacterium]
MPGLTQSDRAALARLSARTSLPAFSRVAVQLAWMYAVWTHRRRSRTQLADLDFRMLEDVGLTPREAHSEARKWFWRP